MVDFTSHQQAREEVLTTARKMNQGYNQGTSGNVSRRVQGGFIITPSGVPYESATPGQMVFVDLEGKESGLELRKKSVIITI